MIKKRILRDKKHFDKVRKWYFSDQDYFETINKGNVIDMSCLLNKSCKDLPIKKYKYKLSEATYKGQWLGGFRHGHGTIVYSDDTKYSGSW